MEPLEPAEQHALLVRTARLRERLAAEFGERPLVEPNARFFPDILEPSALSVTRWLAQLAKHAGMSDVPIAVELTEDAAAAAAKACSSGACCSPKLPAGGAQLGERVLEDGDGWRVLVPAAEFGEPRVLVANLARALGLIFLLETASEAAEIEAPLAVTAELAAVQLGLGAALLPASHIYAKSCGGPSMHQATALNPQQLALAVELFAATVGKSTRALAGQLEPTQAEALSDARELVASNPRLTGALKRSPELVASGSVRFEPPKSWLGRALGGLFGRKSLEDRLAAGELPEDASIEELVAAAKALQSRSPARTRR